MTVHWEKIATLVADGVGLGAGDKVSVFVTDAGVLDAATAFVAEAWRRGAIPQVVATLECFDNAALAWAPLDVLAAAPPVEAAAMQWSTVHVSFRAMVDPEVGADPARIAALKHGRGLISTMRWQGTRWALVRVPTPTWARVMGLSFDDLEREWAASFGDDWPAAETRMRTLCDSLSRTASVVIDDGEHRLELDVTGRTWIPFAGKANWPDGEVATAPVSAHGSIRFDGALSFAGVIIRDLTLTFGDGHVTPFHAAQSEDFIRELLATDPGARGLGELGIGTNAALRTMTGDLLIDEKILGTVHLALGRAYPECGGVNQSALHWDIVKDLRHPGANLWADGVWLIRDGEVRPALRDAACAHT
jgi:aminopeptidase